MIGVARPTRGLEFSESADSLEKNLRGYQSITERTWDQSIPDSFNSTVTLLLDQGADYIWFVEEDVVVPPKTLKLLKKMIDSGADIAAMNYLLKKQKGVISEKRDDDGNILWVSLGCTLVRAKVFETLAQPWFKAGYTVATRHCGSSCVKREFKLAKIDYDYGGQDAYFCWQALQAGFSIKTVPEQLADHLILESLGMADNNNGCHKIKKVKKGTEQ